jgi:CRP-like cAMP-binding protein
MEITITAKEDKKYLSIIRFLGAMRDPVVVPFNTLRNREMEVYAVLLYLNNEKYAEIPEKQRNTLLFSYETRQEISEKLGDLSKEAVYNIMMDLRKKGIIDKKKIIKVIPKMNSISFKFND